MLVSAVGTGAEGREKDVVDEGKGKEAIDVGIDKELCSKET